MTKLGYPIRHPVANGQKQCSQCLEVKPVEQFRQRKQGANRSNSLNSRCRSCLSKNALFKKFERQFGFSLDDYKAMKEAQEGKCAACGIQGPEFTDKGRLFLHLDHNHKTGKVRALVCNRCNWALGFLENDHLVDVLLAYLAEFEEVEDL